MKSIHQKNKNLEMLITLLNKLGIKATEDNLTLSHVKAFLQAKWRKFWLRNTFIDTLTENYINEYIGFPKYKQEQVIWRLHLLESHPQGKQCLQSGQCPCQCTTSEVVLSDPSCDKGCFPEMLKKEDWNLFKKTNKFEIDLTRQKVLLYVK